MALLEIYFIRVGNVLQKSINQQILMVVCLWVFRQSVLLLLWMQCIIFLYVQELEEWLKFLQNTIPYHRESSVFLEKTGTRQRLCNSNLTFISLIQ